MLSHLLASHCHMASAVGADSVRLPWVSVSFPTPGSQAGSSLGSVSIVALCSIAYLQGWEVLRLQLKAWRQCTVRLKFGGDPNKSQPLRNLQTFSFGMGLSGQCPGNLLLLSMPKAVGKKEFLELVLPHISRCEASHLRCAHFQHLLLKKLERSITWLNMETYSSQFHLAHQNL